MTHVRFHSHPLAADFTLEVLPVLPDLAAALEAHVETIWNQEQRRTRRARPFNAPVLSLVDRGPTHLTVRPSEYRRFVARLRRPDLAAALDVRPLAVTGVLGCPEGIVLGRRSDDVMQDAGRWEAVPAGGLDRPDPYAQVRHELHEELGVTADDVVECRAIGLLEDAATGVHDIVFDLRTALSAAELRASHSRGATSEYVELAVVAVAELPAHLATYHSDLAPALVPVLRMAGVLPALA